MGKGGNVANLAWKSETTLFIIQLVEYSFQNNRNVKDTSKNSISKVKIREQPSFGTVDTSHKHSSWTLCNLALRFTRKHAKGSHHKSVGW